MDNPDPKNLIHSKEERITAVNLAESHMIERIEDATQETPNLKSEDSKHANSVIPLEKKSNIIGKLPRSQDQQNLELL